MISYSDIQNLSVCIGRNLIKVLGLVFCFKGDTNSSSVEEVYLEFSDLKFLRFFCSSDGSSIRWDCNELQPVNMDEYGEAIIQDISESDELWKNLVYRKTAQVYLVRSETEECFFAVKFIFDNCEELVIANLGDDLVIRQQLLSKIIEEEKAQFLDLQEIKNK